MTPDATNIVKLISVTSDLEAAPVLSILHNHGISARAVGGFTATFRAEAPGEVTILVHEADLARARELLSELPRQQREIDWSKVDVGDSSPVNDTTDDDQLIKNADRPHPRRHWQVSLLTLFFIQTLLCVLLVVIQDARAAFACVLLLFFLLVVAGTATIATHPHRVKQWLRYGLMLGIAVEAFQLLAHIF